MNKDKAMQMLKAKLFILKQQEQQEKANGIRGESKEIGWGSQIRSCVRQPVTLVQDHRRNEELSEDNHGKSSGIRLWNSRIRSSRDS